MYSKVLKFFFAQNVRINQLFSLILTASISDLNKTFPLIVQKSWRILYLSNISEMYSKNEDKSDQFTQILEFQTK